ncbi:MAG: TolC family protein [Acidobacteriota bacterium]|nr:TolC family protein [Acidobacteriota bacterium]
MARANSPAFQAALAAAGVAHSVKVQARAGLLPRASFLSQFLYTQPNGSSSGVFVANNSTREYIDQANVHESIGVTETATYRSAAAAEDLAKAETDIASRGLVVTVVTRYDAVVVSERKLATARLALADANRFLTITQDRERGGEAAHADVIKAQLQVEQRARDLRDAELALATSRNELAIVIFSDYETGFTVTDDLQAPAALPAFDQVERRAQERNPDVAAATAALQQAGQDVWVARGELLPSLSLDYYYGIDANQFATSFDGVNNLGSSVVASVSVPLWNWGATQSRIASARLRRQQAQVELSFARRQLLADLHSFYGEAATAREALASLERSVHLADESLRLTTLRYQAGEATVLEVVDAQNTLILARDAYDDGEARYHLALANLQTLTGTL